MELKGTRRSHDSIFRKFEENSTASETYDFGLRPRPNLPSHEPVPLFLSDPDGEPDPGEFHSERVRRTGLAAPILAVSLGVSAVAVLVALFQSDITRAIVASAKASINAAMAHSAPQPTSNQPTPRQIPSKDAARVTGPLVLASTAAGDSPPASAAPSREAIATAYQSALQNRAPEAEPTATPAAVPAPAAAAAPVAPAPTKTIDAETLAALTKRAKNLIAVGDIGAARLLLERAANAQDAAAAFLLAETYDPAVLGTRDTRSVTPDPAIARDWYQKAARLGASEAQTRLTQLQN